MIPEDLSIQDVPLEERRSLEPMLNKSFSGLYLWHSKRTLGSIEVVKKAILSGRDVGLAMLKMMEPDLGYVYYVAVIPSERGKGIGGFLLSKSLEYFEEKGANEVLASVEEDNVESLRLFRSKGFNEIEYSDMSKRYGKIRTAILWRRMLVVPGEIVLGKSISPKLIE